MRFWVSSLHTEPTQPISTEHNVIQSCVLEASLHAFFSLSPLLDLPAHCVTVPAAASLHTTPLSPFLVSLVWPALTGPYLLM